MSDTKLTKFIVLQERIKAQDALLRELVDAFETVHDFHAMHGESVPTATDCSSCDLIRRAQAAMKRGDKMTESNVNKIRAMLNKNPYAEVFKDGFKNGYAQAIADAVKLLETDNPAMNLMQQVYLKDVIEQIKTLLSRGSR